MSLFSEFNKLLKHC